MSKRINTAFEKDKACLAAQFIIGDSMGSGIYVAYNKEIYFCTARHVLFNEKIVKRTRNFTLKNPKAKIKSYPKKSNFKTTDLLELDLNLLFQSNQISFHKTIDLCTIRIGAISKGKITLSKGITKLSPNINLYVADSTMIKAAKDIEIGEETYVIGYPKALAKFRPQRPMFNYELPLVRKGIISSMNNYKTFVIDCAVYGGNSGGPVFVAENIFSQVNNGINISTKTYLVGIVTQYVPLVNDSAKFRSHVNGSQMTIPMLENSGYGICISFELLQKEIEKLYLLNNTKKPNS